MVIRGYPAFLTTRKQLANSVAPNAESICLVRRRVSRCRFGFFSLVSSHHKSRQDKHLHQSTPRGVEQIADSSGNTGVTLQGGAQSGALSGDSAQGGALPASTDPDLLAVVNAWPKLPEAARQRIVAVVREVFGNELEGEAN